MWGWLIRNDCGKLILLAVSTLFGFSIDFKYIVLSLAVFAIRHWLYPGLLDVLWPHRAYRKSPHYIRSVWTWKKRVGRFDLTGYTEDPAA